LGGVTHAPVAPLVALRREPDGAPAGEPTGALVLLHGRGADEHDATLPSPRASPAAAWLLDQSRQVRSVHRLPPGVRLVCTGASARPGDAADGPRLSAFLDELPVPMERVMPAASPGAISRPR
jgi:hypothetical protein